jgi:hypothetical protein
MRTNSLPLTTNKFCLEQDALGTVGCVPQCEITPPKRILSIKGYSTCYNTAASVQLIYTYFLGFGHVTIRKNSALKKRAVLKRFLL